MQRILLFITTGALAFSFVFFPAFSYAADDFPTSCKVRSEVTAAEAAKLSGDGGAIKVDAGTNLPDGSANAAVKNAFGIICAFSLIKYITNIFFIIVFAVSVVVIAYAGFLYLTSMGSEDKTKKAKTLLMGATVGVLIALFSRLIPTILQNFLGA